MSAGAWLAAFIWSQWQGGLPLFVALVFAVRFCGLEVELWIPKYLSDGVKDL